MPGKEERAHSVLILLVLDLAGSSDLCWPPSHFPTQEVTDHPSDPACPMFVDTPTSKDI